MSNEEHETRAGVLHAPESYAGEQDEEFHILCDSETLCFVMVKAHKDTSVETLVRECALEHVVTIRAKDELDAEKRMVEIEDWHRGRALTKEPH